VTVNRLDLKFTTALDCHGSRKNEGSTKQDAQSKTCTKSSGKPKKGEADNCTKKVLTDQTSCHAKSIVETFLYHSKRKRGLTPFLTKELTAKINKSIEQQMVSAASSGKLTIMKDTMPVE